MTTSFIRQPGTNPSAADPYQCVAVGVDGSAPSVRALVWALEFAVAHGASVEVVTAWPLHAPIFIGEVPGHFNDARWQAVHAQRQALTHARERGPAGAEVTTRLANAAPEDALLSASVGASLLVLGSRDGTTPTLAARLQFAACPVVVVSDWGDITVLWGHHALAGGLKALSVS